MKTWVIIAFLCLNAAGCVTTDEPAVRRTVFNEAEYAPYSGNGTGRVSGQAFLRTKGGDVKFGAGCIVSMNPVTSYSTEFFSRAVANGERLQAPDPRVEKFNRRVTADGNGNFEFSDLAPGEYYLHCEIKWQVPSQFGLSTTGGVASAKVQVRNGETSRVIVTR